MHSDIWIDSEKAPVQLDDRTRLQANQYLHQPVQTTRTTTGRILRSGKWRTLTLQESDTRTHVATIRENKSHPSSKETSMRYGKDDLHAVLMAAATIYSTSRSSITIAVAVEQATDLLDTTRQHLNQKDLQVSIDEENLRATIKKAERE